MEKYNTEEYEVLKKRKRETAVLAMYSSYNFGIMAVALYRRWTIVSVCILLAVGVIMWMLYAGQYKSYRFRAMASTFLMQISVILYETHTQNTALIYLILTTMIIFASLYELKDTIRITTISVAVMIIYYLVVKHMSQNIWNRGDVDFVVQTVNVLFLGAIMMYRVNRGNENREKLYDMINALEEAEQSKNDFLANVSHEIRTPINTISGMSELLLSGKNQSRTKESLYAIQSASRNLLSVVSDVLDFSELQAGKVELEEEAYNLTSTINDVIHVVMAKNRRRNIRLLVDVDADLPCGLLGDEKKIRRVLMSLLDNGIKFTNEGCVSIQVTGRREYYGLNLSIAVKDTGIGMDEESQEKLFTSFNQVDTRRNRQEGGIGLGLAVSQMLVQKMDGIITVKSKVGEGSCIKFVIPQKILDERPITHIKNKENCKVAIYMDMQQFEEGEVRVRFSDNIHRIVEQLQVNCHICRNFEELKRREEEENFTHIFTSYVEYKQNMAYFDRLSEKTKVALVVTPPEATMIKNPRLLRTYKPFYVLSMVSVLNAETEETVEIETRHIEKFIAPKVHVLVVDDNWMNLKVIEGLLQNYQIKVTTASSGREALEKIETKAFDFVFMDHMMPEMDGIETLHQIRKKVGTYFERVPVIALTANAVAGSREMFLAEGFADFIEKPVELSVLERLLRRNIVEEKLVFLEQGTENKSEPEEVQTETKKEKSIGDEIGATGDLDIEKGLLYCGGREQYLSILRKHCKIGDKTVKRIEELFQKQDWKNYTIEVHAVKSSMLSIGAVQLSEMAKGLEMAGKSQDIDYIVEYHPQMIQEYQRILTELKKNPNIHLEETKTKNSEEEELLEDIFTEKISQLETAMYAFDKEEMLKHIEELTGYQYKGHSMQEILDSAKRKIEMSDYMSAVDTLAKWKKHQEGGEKA